MRLPDDQPDSKFKALLSAHLKQLYVMFYRCLRHHQNAEDMTQQTATHALAKWHQYNVDKPLWPWLARMGARLLSTAVRSRKLKYHIPLKEGENAADIAPADPAPSVLDVLIQHEEEDQIRAAINDLPQRESDIVALYYLGGLPTEEIAQIFELSPSSVYRLLSESRGRLKGLLGDLNPCSRSVDFV